MRNNNIGLYVGFGIMAIQIIVGDYQRNIKQQQYNDRINKQILFTAKNIKTKST